MSNWKPISLREAGVTLIDCDHRTPPATEDGYPYVAIPQMKEGRIDLSGVRRISPGHFVEWTRKAKPQEHDIVLSRRCNPGESAYVPAGLDFALGQNLVLLRADGSKIFPPFLRWLVRGPAWWEQVGRFINVGAVFDSLKCADIPKFTVPLPPLPEQKAIARILGTLDDKIELNRRMNATLEAMARALFQSWFVDFDPVHAKAASRQPSGIDAATAALFPAEFQDSAIGEIPKGWRVGKISDLTAFSRSSINPGNFPEEIFDHYSLPAFDEGRRPKMEVGADIKSNKLTVTPSAVLLSKLNPHIPRIWLPRLSDNRRSVCSTEFLVACPSSKSSQEYLFALFTSNRFSVESVFAFVAALRLSDKSELADGYVEALFDFVPFCVNVIRRFGDANDAETILSSLGLRLIALADTKDAKSMPALLRRYETALVGEPAFECLDAVKATLQKHVEDFAGRSTENTKMTMDQLRHYYADRAAELGINLSDPNDRIAEVVRIGLEDLDPTRVVKNCQHIHVMTTSYGIPAEMLGLPTAGSKRVVCLKHGHGVENLSLDNAYDFFSKVFPWDKDAIRCANCPDKAPHPDGWEWSEAWGQQQNEKYKNMLNKEASS